MREAIATSTTQLQPAANGINGAWENGYEFISPGTQRTTVLAPVITWRITERVALTVDYQWFSRRETPPSAHIKPNIEVVGLPLKRVAFAL